MKMFYGDKYSVLWTSCCVQAVKSTAGFKKTAASFFREAKNSFESSVINFLFRMQSAAAEGASKMTGKVRNFGHFHTV
jgi:hypothetical protein